MTRNAFLIAATAVFMALSGAAVAGAAVAVDLASHLALYSMTLHSAKSGSGVNSVRGEMAVDWMRTCSGWTFEHRSLIDVGFSQGDPVRLSTNATSWESLDGLEYRFSIRNLKNGKLADKVAGVARLGALGAEGSVSFSAPKRRTLVLPAGTMFPVRHSVELIGLVGRAPKMMTRIVFDGMSFDGAFELSAVLGRPATRKANGGKGLEALAGRRYWPVQFAFFPVKSRSPLPENEVGMRVYDNGVSDALLIGFGEFTVRATLSKLQILKPPACG